MTYSAPPGPAGPADGLPQQRRERPEERMSRSRPVRIAQYFACLNQPDSSRYPPDTRVRSAGVEPWRLSISCQLESSGGRPRCHKARSWVSGGKKSSLELATERAAAESIKYIVLRYNYAPRSWRLCRAAGCGAYEGGTMADGYIDRGIASRMSWPAIFAGTFVFLAIEVTFGVLGTAVFASAANPASAHPVSGMSAGIGIWLVILSIIALYFGGRAASALSGTTSSHVGMYHGLV